VTDQELQRLGNVARRSEWSLLADQCGEGSRASASDASLIAGVRSLARFNLAAQHAAKAWRSAHPISFPGLEGQLARFAVERMRAAVNGDPLEARESLARELDEQPSEKNTWEANIPSQHVIELVTGGVRSAAELRVRGIGRPLPHNELGLGDPGSLFTLRLVGFPASYFERGRPMDVVGSWDPVSAAFEVHRVVRLGLWVGHRVLLSVLGVSETEEQMPNQVATDKSAQQPTPRRKLAAEALALRESVDLLERAATSSGISFSTLGEVHRLLAPDAVEAGCLRSTPATVRLAEMPFYHAPPPEVAALQVSHLLRWLSRTSLIVHPFPRAAEAWAGLTRAHPFTDGNGRVARALATRVLTAGGYRLSGASGLRDFAYQFGVEHYQRLLRWKNERLLWYQFCADAVLEIFQAPVTAELPCQIQC